MGIDDSFSTPISHLCPSISTISTERARVDVLFSPFRPRDLNPESYDLKMKFWKKAIEEYLTFSNRVTFTLKEAQKGLMIPEMKKTPACLGDVIESLTRDGVVTTLPKFYDSLKASVSWLAWSQIGAKNILWRIFPIPSPGSLFRTQPETIYVHATHMRDLVSSLEQDGEIRNCLMSLSNFKERVRQRTNISNEEELGIIMEYLLIKKMIELDKVGREDVVMFGDSVNKMISEVDKGKYDVKRTLEVHEQRSKEIEQKIQQVLASAKEALKQGRRATAKHELKKKKLLEQQLGKVMNVLDNLMVISLKLDEAESDAKIIQAYQSGKQALKDVMKKNNLTQDTVTEALLDVQDVLEEHDDIQAALSQPLDDDKDISEYEAELDQLLKDDQDAKEEDELDDLVDRLQGLKVPTDTINSPLRDLRHYSQDSPASIASDLPDE